MRLGWPGCERRIKYTVALHYQRGPCLSSIFLRMASLDEGASGHVTRWSCPEPRRVDLAKSNPTQESTAYVASLAKMAKMEPVGE
jgi:hypothetical protein